MSKRPLPPLDLLVPFEAAARLRSFTLAAEELCVTQSAVSQRIRNLEAHLGISLFERNHRRIELTADGRELLNGVTVALNHLSSATASVRRTDRESLLRISADTSIASMVLMPLLTEFRALHPHITVDLTTSDLWEDALNVDVAILHNSAELVGYTSTMLFADQVYPVCSPDYLRRHPIETPEDLLTADLIDLDYQHWNWINWGIWLTETGLDPTKARRSFQSNSYHAGIDAARAGWGVALGWKHFVDTDVARGALVRPLEDIVATEFGYALFQRVSEKISEEAKIFSAWIRSIDLG